MCMPIVAHNLFLFFSTGDIQCIFRLKVPFITIQFVCFSEVKGKMAKNCLVWVFWITLLVASLHKKMPNHGDKVQTDAVRCPIMHNHFPYNCCGDRRPLMVLQ